MRFLDVLHNSDDNAISKVWYNSLYNVYVASCGESDYTVIVGDGKIGKFKPFKE